jgi:hypothetical protein
VKIGDMVQHKRRGWTALVLEINDHNRSADIMWLGELRSGMAKFDNCSMSQLKVINEVS